jgi:hypothetical protein
MRGLTLLPSRLREGAGEGLFALSYTREVGLPTPKPTRKGVGGE